MNPIHCSCGKTIVPQPEWAGRRVRCSGCAATLYVPHPAEPASVPAPNEPEAPSETKSCPYCAETIQARAIKCRYCGQDLVRRRQRRTSSPSRVDNGGTAPLVYGILGWVLCGIFLPIAWATGSGYENECRARGVEPSGAGKAGKIMGMIGTIFLGGILLLALVLAAVGA